jgi:hypothetical protein
MDDDLMDEKSMHISAGVYDGFAYHGVNHSAPN